MHARTIATLRIAIKLVVNTYNNNNNYWVRATFPIRRVLFYVKKRSFTIEHILYTIIRKQLSRNILVICLVFDCLTDRETLIVSAKKYPKECLNIWLAVPLNFFFINEVSKLLRESLVKLSSHAFLWLRCRIRFRRPADQQSRCCACSNLRLQL